MDVRTLCLAVLHKGEASGYEIKKAFEEGPFAHFQTASFGAIYPALGQLRKSGMVTVSTTAQDGRPDKKVYRLTDTGRQKFLHSLAFAPGPDQIRSDLLFLLFFAELLPVEQVATLIDDRIGAYRAAIARIDALSCDPTPNRGTAFVRGFGRAIYETGAQYLEDNRDTLLQRLGRSDAQSVAAD